MKRPPLFLVLLTLALALLPSCTPPGGGADAKPVIYLYPEAETDVTVTGRASAGRNMTSPRASAYQAGTPPPFWRTPWPLWV